VDRALAAGVDMVQIRERDLDARDVLILTEAVAETAHRHSAGLLLNDRVDVAAAAGAGVHLTTRSLPVELVRRAFPPGMLVGVSTHTFEEAAAAQRGGADFVVFGPVFETVSKREYGEPVGLKALGQVATHLAIPVLALGGIKESNFREALDAGAAGVAGISMFAESHDLGYLVAMLKGAG